MALDDWFFQCHFLGDPVQPGCLGVDGVWQLLGFFIAWSGGLGAGRALGCGEVEFFGQVRPHDRLVRYEVSNWCQPAHHSRYNLSIWAMGEFVGFGLGAHDHRDGRRSRNVRRLDAYLSMVESGVRPRSGSERLSATDAERERVAIGLRLVAGVEAGEHGVRFLKAAEGQRHLEAGTVTRKGNRIVVERPLLTDAVARATLSVSP